MNRRVVAWAEISLVFLALYLGVPLAGLTLDRGLGLPEFPVALRFAGLVFLFVGLTGLAWCFSLFAGARGTPNPTAAKPTRHFGAIRVDTKPDCGVSLPCGAG